MGKVKCFCVHFLLLCNKLPQNYWLHTHFLAHSFCASGAQVWLNWVLRMFAIKVLARAECSSEGSTREESTHPCPWQNLFLCGCRIHDSWLFQSRQCKARFQSKFAKTESYIMSCEHHPITFVTLYQLEASHRSHPGSVRGYHTMGIQGSLGAFWRLFTASRGI